MRPKTLILDLNGPFSLAFPDGREIRVPSARCKAMLAILATSPKGKRSREWLRATLWPNSSEKQSFESLRNALSALRRHNQGGLHVIEADRSCVWIKDVTLVPLKPGGHTRLFDDADSRLGEEFEDWLRDFRLNAEEHPVPTALQPESEPASIPVIAINLPVVQSDDPHANIAATVLCDHIVTAFRSQELVSVLDLRDTMSDQMRVNQLSAVAPTALVTLKLMKHGSFARLSVSVTQPRTGTVLWNSSIGADQASSFLLSGANLADFVSMATDSIMNAVLDQADKRTLQPTLMTSVHHIMNMAPDAQQSARRLLQDSGTLDDSAVAKAWYALSIANSIGERGQSGSEELLAEARMHCAHALEKGRCNPLVLILVSHVYSFLFGQIDHASDLAERARAQGKFLPLVWDLSAMNALYRNQPVEAVTFSQKAADLSRYSPYRQFFLSSLAISSSVAGDHDTALRVGRRVLSHLPGFLAVQRHMAASMAATDRLEDARSLIKNIQARDHSFTLADVRAGRAALPSSASRDLIEHAFKKAGY